METTTNVELAREIFDVLNRRDYARFADYCAEDLTVTSGEGIVKGLDAVIAQGHQTFLEFPDTIFTIVDTLMGESRVGVEYVFTGTNTGELDMGPGMGKLPPTGKQVTVPGFWVFTFKDGKVTSIAQYADMLSLLMQLGVTPTPALAPAQLIHAPRPSSRARSCARELALFLDSRPPPDGKDDLRLTKRQVSVSALLYAVHHDLLGDQSTPVTDLWELPVVRRILARRPT